MADKAISGLTAATSLAAADLLLIENAGGNSRKITAANANLIFSGALVHKASDQTGANYSAGAVVAWDSEASGYDTTAYHDTSSDPSRITIPANGKYKFEFALEIGTLSASDYVRAGVIKNGSVATFVGSKFTITEISAVVNNTVHGGTAVIDCTAGQYFEVWLDTESDTTITVTAIGSWFSVHRVA